MIFRLILLSLSSAGIGWFTVWLSGSLMLKKMSNPRSGIFERLSKMVASSFNVQSVTSKISDANNLQFLRPELDKHMDHFLRVKLKESMPIVGMFIGDKTIGQLKEVFMIELESLFPIVMSSYVNRLQSELDVEKLVAEQLSAIPATTLSAGLKEIIYKDLRLARTMGAVLGLCVGLLQSIFIYISFS